MSREVSKPRDDAAHRRMRGALVRLISPFIVVAIDVNREGSQRHIMLMLMPRSLMFCVFPAESDFLFDAPVEPGNICLPYMSMSRCRL